MTNTEYVMDYINMEYSEWVTEYSTEHRVNPQHAVNVHTKVIGICNVDYG
jgi:hypothetical protein